jgi:hypothetical protein
MHEIRPLTAADLLPLAELRNRSDGRPDRDLKRVADFYRSRFLEHPRSDDRVRSLVCAAKDGSLIGFSGAVPRTAIWDGGEIRVAVLSHYMVDAERGAGLAAVRLMRTMMNGAQDVSLTDEATPRLEDIWRGLRGASADALHLHWVRPLRPARLVLERLRARGGVLRGLAALGRPLSAPGDAVFARLGPARQRGFTPSFRETPLGAEELLAEWKRFGRDRALRSRPDATVLDWMLARARERRDAGEFRADGFRLPDGRLAGWALWYLAPGGSCEVVQLAASLRTVRDILDQLFQRAWAGGALAVTGRLEPPFLGAFADRHCLFERRGVRTLVHSRDPQLVRAFQAGDVFFSRLEGEWCLWFP